MFARGGGSQMAMSLAKDSAKVFSQAMVWLKNKLSDAGSRAMDILRDTSGHVLLPGKVSPVSSKSVLKEVGLPTSGKIRFVPPKSWNPSQPLPRLDFGYVDKFGNVWKKGPSRTLGQLYEWDVQLSLTGRNQLGWATRDGLHLNVSLDGRITHR